MKYSIDRIEKNIAILENIETKKKKEVSISLLPKEIEEGSILIEEQNTYHLDKEEELLRKSNIINRFQRLKKK